MKKNKFFITPDFNIHTLEDTNLDKITPVALVRIPPISKVPKDEHEEYIQEIVDLTSFTGEFSRTKFQHKLFGVGHESLIPTFAPDSMYLRPTCVTLNTLVNKDVYELFHNARKLNVDCPIGRILKFFDTPEDFISSLYESDNLPSRTFEKYRKEEVTIEDLLSVPDEIDIQIEDGKLIVKEFRPHADFMHNVIEGNTTPTSKEYLAKMILLYYAKEY